MEIYKCLFRAQIIFSIVATFNNQELGDESDYSSDGFLLFQAHSFDGLTLPLRDYLSFDVKMKPTVVADEMFPEGAGPYMDLEEAGGSGSILMDLAANEKAVHADFFNDFEDLYDDEDLQ